MSTKDRGYEGEACSDCGAFTLLRNGTFVKCDTCGATSGESAPTAQKLPPIGTVEGPKGSFS